MNFLITTRIGFCPSSRISVVSHRHSLPDRLPLRPVDPSSSPPVVLLMLMIRGVDLLLVDPLLHPTSSPLTHFLPLLLLVMSIVNDWREMRTEAAHTYTRLWERERSAGTSVKRMNSFWRLFSIFVPPLTSGSESCLTSVCLCGCESDCQAKKSL